MPGPEYPPALTGLERSGLHIEDPASQGHPRPAHLLRPADAGSRNLFLDPIFRWGDGLHGPGLRGEPGAGLELVPGFALSCTPSSVPQGCQNLPSHGLSRNSFQRAGLPLGVCWLCFLLRARGPFSQQTLPGVRPELCLGKGDGSGMGGEGRAACPSCRAPGNRAGSHIPTDLVAGSRASPFVNCLGWSQGISRGQNLPACPGLPSGHGAVGRLRAPPGWTGPWDPLLVPEPSVWWLPCPGRVCQVAEVALRRDRGCGVGSPATLPAPGMVGAVGARM